MTLPGRTLLEAILEASESYPLHLHRHILQMYSIQHRRAPSSETERRRAVHDYLSRTRHDKTGTVHIFVNPELTAWLVAEDEQVRGWGPIPRLAGLMYQFNGEFRKRYDLGVERDYKEFACYLALSVQGVLRWPEEIVAESLRSVLWEPAPGIASRSKIGVTRALNYIRRKASRVRHLDLSKVDGLSQLLMSSLADIEDGKLPSYTLSPDQYDYLTQPVKLRQSKLRISGLMYHLIVERGMVDAGDLSRPDVAQVIARETPRMLARLRLPRRLREAHGARAATVTPIASRAAADEPIPMVTVVGPLSHGSGLGAAARACVEAFKSAKIPVEVLNLVATWGRTDEDEGGEITTRIRGDINVIHFNPDVIIENLSRFGIEQFAGRYNIGYFVWETSQASFAHRLGVDLVDEVWVPTLYCKKIFERITDKPVVVVRTPVPKIDDVSWATRRYFEIPGGKFTFVFTLDGASRFTRKNPIAAVEAFQRAFPTEDDVQLVIKTQNTDRLPAPDERMYAEIRRRVRHDRRIIVIDESFSSNEVHGLISVCDCYVALHRSEGFGYGMAEAMKLSVPVVATGDSGNADFTTEETAYPVRHRRVPVPKGEFVYEEVGQEWAEPDVEHAAQRMREVRMDPHRHVRVAQAFALIHEHYNENAVGRAYRERIEAIRAGSHAEADAVKMGA